MAAIASQGFDLRLLGTINDEDFKTFNRTARGKSSGGDRLTLSSPTGCAVVAPFNSAGLAIQLSAC
jgi:hypothetical protein